MKTLIATFAALAALTSPLSAAERTIGSTFVGLVETDSGHKEVTHIITDAGTNPNGTTWFAYASPIVTLADMRGGNDQ